MWEFNTSPEAVVPCIPVCGDVEQIDPKHYKAGINIQIGPIKTTFNVQIEVMEERPLEFASYVTQGSEGGKAGKLNARSTLPLIALYSNNIASGTPVGIGLGQKPKPVYLKPGKFLHLGIDGLGEQTHQVVYSQSSPVSLYLAGYYLV